MCLHDEDICAARTLSELAFHFTIGKVLQASVIECDTKFLGNCLRERWVAAAANNLHVSHGTPLL